MQKMQALKGFRDIGGDEIAKFRHIELIARRYLDLMGFLELQTPVLERTELFVKSIGDTTDIVEKEMFTFTDLGGDSVSLRPEGTAGIVRAYLQGGLYVKERLSKLFSVGPMFRHEKPQKGRFRQFHQVDVEVFGVADPLIDAELLWLIHLILSALQASSHTIEVNSVGCPACREAFKTVSVSYFEDRKGQLCEDCVRRLKRNPLRIFDCKKTPCIEVSQEGSPYLFEHLCDDCRDHFDTFMGHIAGFGIDVTVNKRLVRGLDYYTKTVFEVTSQDLGAQKAFIAGGRYDNLVEEMGGPKTPGTGFAIGMERLALLTRIEAAPERSRFFFAYVGDRARGYLAPILKSFTKAGLSLLYSYDGRSLKSQMRYADGLKTDFVLLLGDDEIDRGIITVRDMRRKTQAELALDISTLTQDALRMAGIPSVPS
jgi:histidyl-tRNA synthetase